MINGVGFVAFWRAALCQDSESQCAKSAVPSAGGPLGRKQPEEAAPTFNSYANTIADPILLIAFLLATALAAGRRNLGRLDPLAIRATPADATVGGGRRGKN